MPYPNQPKDTPIPPQLHRWNWGAFLLNWIWGLGNSTYIALLMFVPFVNLIMIFVLGAKGSEWAWKNRLWENEDHFVRTQRNWALAGLAVLLALPLLMGLFFYLISLIFTSSDAYKLSLEQVRANKSVIEIMGEPIQPGWFITGQIKTSGASGTANLSIPISGPNCSGNAISRSTKIDGEWKFHLLIVKFDCNSDTIVLINERNIVIPKSGEDI